MPLAAPRHERHNYNTASRSVSAQGDAGGSPVSVIAVGAICSASAAAAGSFPSTAPDESCLDTSHATPEFFSSRGPTLDGRQKPDLAAIDGVAITGAGSVSDDRSSAPPRPRRTSAAIAALMLQAAPCLLNRAASTVDAASARATLRNLIVGKALALTPAPDNVVGAGRVDAFASVQSSLATWSGTTTLTVDADTVVRGEPRRGATRASSIRTAAA